MNKRLDKKCRGILLYPGIFEDEIKKDRNYTDPFYEILFVGLRKKQSFSEFSYGYVLNIGFRVTAGMSVVIQKVVPLS